MVSLKLGSKLDSFQLQGQAWVYPNGLPSDIIIQVGEISFHLHKFPLLSRSGWMEKKIGELQPEEGAPSTLQLHDIPGGSETFELVSKFCYGIKIELNASNVVFLRCAAEFLNMTEDYGDGNLVFQTENFLNKVFNNWKDTITAIETFKQVLLQAEELNLVARCIDALASKACTETAILGGCPTAFKKNPGGTLLWNGIGAGTERNFVVDDWWHEDAASLGLPLYKRLLSALEAKGMKPEGIASSLMLYARRHIPGLTGHSAIADSVGSPVKPGEIDERSLLEEIVRLLPSKKGVTPTKFLLSLLRTCIMLQASDSTREILEQKAGEQMDEAALDDLLIPNMDTQVEALYDVDCVKRILEHFMFAEQSMLEASSGTVDDGHLISTPPSLTPMTSVAKLMDGYLAEIAPDENVKLPTFQSLAEAFPDYARPLDDGLYRAIDIYLKAHPWLTDLEREQLCRMMNCQKLSLEACTHAAQNERLPLRMIVQVLFFEQLRLRTSIAGWFFVSDNIENSCNSHEGNLAEGRKNSEGGPAQTEISEEVNGKSRFNVSGDVEMRLRLSELEEECKNIKKEIDRIGKTKNTSSWNIFPRKLGV